MLRTMIIAAAVAVTGMASTAPVMADDSEFVVRVPDGPNPDPSEFVLRGPDNFNTESVQPSDGRAEIAPPKNNPNHMTDRQRAEIGNRCMIVLDDPNAYSPDVVAFCEGGL